MSTWLVWHRRGHTPVYSPGWIYLWQCCREYGTVRGRILSLSDLSQRVQKSLARVVCKTSKFCHITPVFIRYIDSKSSTELISKLTLWYIKHSILISLCTFDNYCHCQKNKEPVPQELDSLFDLVLLKPRLVLLLSMLLLHSSWISFMQKYEQLRLIPSFAKK